MDISFRKPMPGVLAGLAFLFAACTQSDNSAPPTSASPIRAEMSNDPSATPTPVATIVLPNGNNLEFYDFGSAVMISESGLAGTAPGVSATNSPRVLEKQAAIDDRLAAIWRGLAKDKPVPKALLDIQARWKNPALRPQPISKPAISQEVSGIPMGPRPMQSPALGKTAAPQGCNNGC